MKSSPKGSEPVNDLNAPAPNHKKRYRRPVLRVYGSVNALTRGGGATVADAGGAMSRKSDRRVKENIVRIGDHPLGFGLYLFDYNHEYCREHGSGRQFGVMADEVETVMPEAVSVHPDGYKMVDYGRLGITIAVP